VQKTFELLILPFFVNLVSSALFAWIVARWSVAAGATEPKVTTAPRTVATQTVAKRLGVANRPMFPGESVLVTMTQGLMLWFAWWFPPAVISFRTPVYLDTARGIGPLLPQWRLDESNSARALLLGLCLTSLIVVRLLLQRPARWIVQLAWPENPVWQERAAHMLETCLIALASAAIATANVWAFTSLSVPNAVRVVIGGLVAALLFIGSRART
jgi:hypothetical protein